MKYLHLSGVIIILYFSNHFNVHQMSFFPQCTEEQK